RLGGLHAHALTYQCPDLLRGAFALGQQVLAVDVRLLAPGIQRGEMRHVKVKATSRKRAGNALRILPDRLDIHRPDSSCTSTYKKGSGVAPRYTIARVKCIASPAITTQTTALPNIYPMA